ncbi:MAG: hypothetical protein RIR79_526 [Pseudomonadota bacterium]|jgi:hypothetical protein
MQTKFATITRAAFIAPLLLWSSVSFAADVVSFEWDYPTLGTLYKQKTSMTIGTGVEVTGFLVVALSKLMLPCNTLGSWLNLLIYKKFVH